MPTKIISIALTSALGAAVMGMPAYAGGACGGQHCGTAVQVFDAPAPQFGPLTVRNQNPLGHLRSVDFQRAPNVSITRVHGLAPTAALSDAPSSFTGGCHPTSVTYCRQDAGVPVQVELAPQAVFQAPVISAPQVVSAPRTVAIGGGYDPSKFTPRVYGDPTFVPGIAHVPTSIVDRDPVRAQQVLDSGRTVPQPVLGRDTFGGTVPNPGFVQQNFVQHNVVQPNFVRPNFVPQGAFSVAGPQIAAPVFQAPAQGFVPAGAPTLQNRGPFAGAYGSPVGSDGTYWEKVSGPTSFGDTVASEVLCKRQIPQRVVNPVVPVPYPVPVQTQLPHGCVSGAHGFGHAQAPQLPVGRYGASEPGRWTR